MKSKHLNQLVEGGFDSLIDGPDNSLWCCWCDETIYESPDGTPIFEHWKVAEIDGVVYTYWYGTSPTNIQEEERRQAEGRRIARSTAEPRFSIRV